MRMTENASYHFPTSVPMTALPTQTSRFCVTAAMKLAIGAVRNLSLVYTTNSFHGYCSGFKAFQKTKSSLGNMRFSKELNNCKPAQVAGTATFEIIEIKNN